MSETPQLISLDSTRKEIQLALNPKFNPAWSADTTQIKLPNSSQLLRQTQNACDDSVNVNASNRKAAPQKSTRPVSAPMRSNTLETPTRTTVAAPKIAEKLPPQNISDIGFWSEASVEPTPRKNNTIAQYFLDNGQTIFTAIIATTLIGRYGKKALLALKFVPQLLKKKQHIKQAWEQLSNGTAPALIDKNKPVGSFVTKVIAGDFQNLWRPVYKNNPNSIRFLKSLKKGQLTPAWQAFKNTHMMSAIREFKWLATRSLLVFTVPSIIALRISNLMNYCTYEVRKTNKPLDLEAEINELRNNPDEYMAKHWKTVGLNITEGAPYANGVLVKLDVPISDATPLVRRMPQALITAIKQDIQRNGENSKFKLGSKGEILTEEPIRITHKQPFSDGTKDDCEIVETRPMLVAYVGPYRNNPMAEFVYSETYAQGSTDNSYSKRSKWSFGPFDGHKISYSTEKTYNYSYSAATQNILQHNTCSPTMMPNVNLRQQKTTYLASNSRKITFWDGNLINTHALQPTQYTQYGTDFTMGSTSLYTVAGIRERFQMVYAAQMNKPVAQSWKDANPVHTVFKSKSNTELLLRTTNFFEVGIMPTLFTYKSKDSPRYTMDFYFEPIQSYPGAIQMNWMKKQGFRSIEPSWNTTNIDFSFRFWTSDNSKFPDITNHVSAPEWQPKRREGLRQIISAEPVSDKEYRASLLQSE